MYSVVLMMAMTTGGEVTAFHRSHCSCSGYSSCGCSGYVGRGGCCASSCHGGYGGRIYGCSGGYGCCHGGYACCGGTTMRSGYYPNGYAGSEVTVRDPRRATITVSVPPDARIFFDDQPTTSVSSRRVFLTPPLQPGADYSYTVQANLERNGKMTSLRKQVTVRAGQESQVSFEFPAAENVGAPAPQTRGETAPPPRTEAAPQPRTDAPPQPRKDSQPNKAPPPNEK
jgi:uncharacterized protein (TIGR03000 family)